MKTQKMKFIMILCLIPLILSIINKKTLGYYVDDKIEIFESDRDENQYYADQVPDPYDAWVSMKMQYDFNQILKIILIGGVIIFIFLWSLGKV